MKRNLVLTTIVIFTTFLIKAVNIDIPVLPDSLTRGANSIVLNDHTNIQVTNISTATISRIRSLMIVNEKGEAHADFKIMLDKSTSLKRFKGSVYDSTGNIIFEIGKNDLTSSEYSPYLAVDNVICSYDLNMASYPFIVTYKWEERRETYYPILRLTRWNLTHNLL